MSGSAEPWRPFFKLVPNKAEATSMLKGRERLWGIDQHFWGREGELVCVMNYFCATTEALIEAARRLPPERWNCYEMVRAEYPCVLFFDTEDYALDVALVMEEVKVFIGTVPGLEDVEVTYGVKDACSETKISRHILVWMHRRSNGRQVFLKNIKNAGALARRIVASFVTEEEREVSKKRRVLHGRIEILKSELIGRLKGRDEGDLSVVDVDALSKILAGRLPDLDQLQGD